MEVINLAAYVEHSYEEKLNRDGIVNYGDDNLFPQYLVDLYHSSATHNALVNTIAQMIYGDGVFAKDLDTKLAMQSWDLDSELRKACLDFKIQGGFALEVAWSVDRTTIANVRHCPFELLRAGEADEDEKVRYYYYSKDWSDKRQEVTPIYCFDPENNVDHPTQILYVKPFSPGSFYYPKPDYIGSIDYIELDKEIGKYHINNIKNGLAPSFSIHFKNGTPPKLERDKIRTDIERQLTGASNAGKFIVTYSDDPDRKPDFEPFPLSDAHSQYQFLSEEVTAKIMVGHRVTNPMMFGVAVSGKLGGGNELEESSKLFEQNVIKGYRQVLDEAVRTLLNGANLDSQLVMMSDHSPEEVDLESAYTQLDAQGEEVGDDWVLIDSREVDYDSEDSQDALWTFARVLPSTASKKSEQDTDIIKVRYAYAPELSGKSSREFCNKMVAASRSGKVYRKEDIIAAGNKVVNEGWGAKGADKYSIWKFKGGGSCRHFWKRQTYLKKDNGKVSVKRAEQIIREAGVGAKRLDRNDKAVAQRPRDMDNRGFLPSNKAARNIKTPR